MRLVITGCNGRVGKRAVLLALKRGHTVTGIDLTPCSDELAGAIQQDQRFTFRQIDLKEYEHVLEALQTSKCEAVVHLAAFPNPNDYKVVTHNWFESGRCLYCDLADCGVATLSYPGISYELVRRYDVAIDNYSLTRCLLVPRYPARNNTNCTSIHSKCDTDDL